MITLYFEGAGIVPRGEVENCRIRTAFHTDDGQRIYLEMMGFDITEKMSKSLYAGLKVGGIVDACFYITDNRNDCNENPIKVMKHKTFEYTKENILSFVNSLGCSFEAVMILPDLAGYRVFKDGPGCNYGDEFIFNPERTARAEEIEKHFYALEKSEGKQYPNLSLWVDQDNPGILHLLRHFNGYNKHWTICNVENWQGTIKETLLGKYAV